MKKIISLCLIILVSVLTMSFINFSDVYANDNIEQRDVTTETGKIIIPFEKRWSNVSDDVKPKTLNVKLYKYIGDEFNESSAILVKSIELSSENNWKCEFDISNEQLFDSQNNSYKFKVVEEAIPGFEELEHQDPGVTFMPPAAGNSWERVTTDSTTIFKLDENVQSIIVATTTGNQGNITVVWSLDALSESERLMIFNSVQNSDLPSVFKRDYNSFVFISGTVGSFINKNEKIIEVSLSEINFLGGTKVWQQFAKGTYSKSSTETNAAYITNGIKRIDITVEKVWNDHNNILELRPNDITIQLLKNNVVINEVKLSQNNNWSYTFTGLYEYTDGVKNEYQVKELDISNYISSSKQEGNKFIITNTREVESTNVSVKKIWNNVDQIEQLPGVIVGLYYKTGPNEPFYELNRIVLNYDNNWQYTFNSGRNVLTGKLFDILPAEYIYEVREIGLEVDESEMDFYNDFFITEHANTGNSWTITNTCTASYVLPETGNSGGLILTIVVVFLLGTPIVYIIYPFVERFI